MAAAPGCRREGSALVNIRPGIRCDQRMIALARTTARISRVRWAALLATGSFCLAAGADTGFMRIVSWNPRLATPALELESIEGERRDLEKPRGTAVVLNFWATWCEPCLAEMSQLRELARRHEHDRSLVVLGGPRCGGAECAASVVQVRATRS